MRDLPLFLLLFLLLLPLGLTACHSSSPQWEEVGPRVRGGYYVDTTQTGAISLVAVRMEGEQTYADIFLTYGCRGETFSSFQDHGITFSSSPVTLPAPSIFDGLCRVESELYAYADNAIRAHVRINNGVISQVQDYILTKADKQGFLNVLQDRSVKSTHFSADDELCVKNFGQSCAQISLLNKK